MQCASNNRCSIEIDGNFGKLSSILVHGFFLQPYAMLYGPQTGTWTHHLRGQYKSTNSPESFSIFAYLKQLNNSISCDALKTN